MLCTVALALLTLPLHPYWPDYEAARRGIAMVLAAPLLIGVAFAGHRALPRALALPLLLLLAWHALSLLWAANPGLGLLRCTWLAALFVAMLAGAQLRTPAALLDAATAVGAAVAVLGLAQGLGVAWPAGATPADAVSTLGNRNVASEVVTLCLIAAALRLVRAPRVALRVAAILACTAYLWLNHSRAGLLAAALALVPLSIAPWRHHPWRRRALLAVTLLVGLAAGALVRARLEAPPPGGPALAVAPPAANDGEPLPARSTVEVRLELWKAGLAMVADAPLRGHGAGQFRVDYPRYRSEAEIELSTFGRQFAAAPRALHQDGLEIAVETGLPGLALLLLVVVRIALRLRRGGWAAALPLLGFAALACVRSPLGNAPAAMLAAAWAGCACSEPLGWRPGMRLRALSLLPAIALGAIGLRVAGAETAAAAHVFEMSRPPAERSPLRSLRGLDRASADNPAEPSYVGMATRLRLGLALAESDPAPRRAALQALIAEPDGGAARLARLAPFSTTDLMTVAECHLHAGDPTAARRVAERVLALDPRDPAARLCLAALAVARGDAGTAVALLYAGGEPHPRLRADLARHLADLVGTAADDAVAARLRGEAAFVAAADAVAAEPLDGRDATARVVAATRAADAGDLRPLFLAAALQVRLGHPENAVRALDAVKARGQARLAPVDERIAGAALAPLRALPAWRPHLHAP